MRLDGTKGHGRREAGNTIVAALAVLLVLGGISTSLLRRSVGGSRAMSASVFESKLLFVAESGLHYNYPKLEADPLYPVRDAQGFAVNAEAQTYDGGEMPLGADSDAPGQSFRLSIQYLRGRTPVLFADRADPVEEFDRIKVFSSASAGPAERIVASWYRFVTEDSFGGAIVSTKAPEAGVSSVAARQARAGDIVINTRLRNGQHYVYGDIRANGAVRHYENDIDEPDVVTPANAATILGGREGSIVQGLGGSGRELPDLSGGAQGKRLFDFDRLEAAAAAGAGAVYDGLDAFATAMNAANASGLPLEGVIVVRIDPSVEGRSLRIVAAEADSRTEVEIAGGVNVTGTIVFRVVGTSTSEFKVTIKTGLNVNAADLSAVDWADPSSFTTGYPGDYRDLGNRPQSVDISPGFANYVGDDDLPAVVFDSGRFEIAGPANVSGVVFAEGFLEIATHGRDAKYFNGGVVAGSGVYLEGRRGPSGGRVAIKHDANAMDSLATLNHSGQRLKRAGFVIVR